LFNTVERLISSRNLRPKKKEGFLKVISIFSFLGIMLGVAILIIVMSVMNGFRTELTSKILGFNPHIKIEPYSSKIDSNYKNKISNKYKDFKIVETFTGEGVIMGNNSAKGVIIKSTNDSTFLKKNLIQGNFKDFEKGSVIIGKELAINLDVVKGDILNLISTASIGTPIGSVPKRETYLISGVFDSGFYEFDQNVLFIKLNDGLSFFNKTENDIALELYISEPFKADIFKKEIEKLNENFYVYSWTDLNKSFFGALKIERNVMFVILTLIIIVAAFNIISGLTILIKNKTKEIAILKTLGLSNKSITKSFFLTGFTIGLFATITGTIIGVVFSHNIEDIRFFVSNTFNLEIFPADIYFLDKLPSEINVKSTGAIFIFSILITAIASYFPAKIVSRMDTIKALKYE
jgi:lipoprotein-releasing system permease protein